MGQKCSSLCEINLCLARPPDDFPELLNPLSGHLTLSYNFKHDGRAPFKGGKQTISPQGLQIPCAHSHADPDEGSIIYHAKDYSRPAQTSLTVAGRVCVSLPKHPPHPSLPPPGVCVFAVNFRGASPATHTQTQTQTQTASIDHHPDKGTSNGSGCGWRSGLYLSFYACVEGRGRYYLVPQLSVLTDGCEEVPMDEEGDGGALGPLTGTDVVVDFVLADHRGRDVYADVIARSSGATRRPLRVQLLSEVAFNNWRQPATLTLGYSQHSLLGRDTSVHLQALYVSECASPHGGLSVPYNIAATAPAALRYMARNPHTGAYHTGEQRVLFKGHVAWEAAMAVKDNLTALQRTKSMPPTSIFTCEPSPSQLPHHLQEKADISSVWFAHVEINLLTHPGTPEGCLYLTRRSLPHERVYMACYMTLAEAVCTSVVWRFTCVEEDRSMITSQNREYFNQRDRPLLMRGVVLGLDTVHDTSTIIRAAISHKNEYLSEQLLCELPVSEWGTTQVYQEVYDSGTHIIYRVTVEYGRGVVGRQQAVLKAEMPHDVLVQPPREEWGAQDIQLDGLPLVHSAKRMAHHIHSVALFARPSHPALIEHHHQQQQMCSEGDDGGSRTPDRLLGAPAAAAAGGLPFHTPMSYDGCNTSSFQSPLTDPNPGFQSPLVQVDEDGRHDDDVFTPADGADEEGRGAGIHVGPTEDSGDDYEPISPLVTAIRTAQDNTVTDTLPLWQERSPADCCLLAVLPVAPFDEPAVAPLHGDQQMRK